MNTSFSNSHKADVTDLEKLEQEVLFSRRLTIAEQRQNNSLNHAPILLPVVFCRHPDEQPREVLSVCLQEIEELLIQLKLALRRAVQGTRARERIPMRREHRRPRSMNRSAVSAMTPARLDELLVVLDILDDECNLDIELAQVVLERLVLADTLNDLLPEPLNLDLLLEVCLGVVQEVNEILDGTYANIRPQRELPILLAGLLSAVQRLDLDDLV